MSLLLGLLEQKLGLAGFELTAVVANMVHLAVKSVVAPTRMGLTYTIASHLANRAYKFKAKVQNHWGSSNFQQLTSSVV